MSAEPKVKVLLEWAEPETRNRFRIVHHHVAEESVTRLERVVGGEWLYHPYGERGLITVYDALSARHARVREAANWVLHVECGVGKSGDRPTDSERVAALSALRAALEDKV